MPDYFSFVSKLEIQFHLLALPQSCPIVFSFLTKNENKSCSSNLIMKGVDLTGAVNFVVTLFLS